MRDKVPDILLFNPYHDRLGRFASKVRSGVGGFLEKHPVAKGAAIGAAAHGVSQGVSAVAGGSIVSGPLGVITGITRLVGSINARGNARKTMREYETKSGTAAQFKVMRAHETLEAAEIGIGASLSSIALGGIFTVIGIMRLRKAQASKRAWDEWGRSYTGQAKQRPWPSGASQDQFKKMYRDLAKKYHPDIGGDTATMQQVNDAHARNDWGGLENLWKQLSDYMLAAVSAEDFQEAAALLVAIFKDVLAEGLEYATIPSIPGNNLFPEEDGKIIFDRPFMKFVVDVVEAQ